VASVSTDEFEKCFSTLNRIKSVLRDSLVRERQHIMAVLSKHKKHSYLADMPGFSQKIIGTSGGQNIRRTEYLCSREGFFHYELNYYCRTGLILCLNIQPVLLLLRLFVIIDALFSCSGLSWS
jgi:hypothetical protein